MVEKRSKTHGRTAARLTKILVVDDDPIARLVCSGVVKAGGYEAVEAVSCAEAQLLCRDHRPHAAILDYQLGDGNALDLMTRLHEIDPALAVVVLTAHGSIELAVEAMRQGANHFLTKPVEPEVLTVILDRSLGEGRQQRQRRAYNANRARHQPDPFGGASADLRQLETMARKVCGSDRPVLLTGETGCGKGVLARWLHEHGQRAGEPFLELNCAGLKPEFLESELFGYKKGAFTGAADSKPGLLQVADRGTLFLDEIGDMDLGIQAKLLKVIEEMTFRPLGEVSDRRVDVRIIAATHRDLAAMVRAQEFRADLYFRIHTLRLAIPPLRDRRRDLPGLVDRFLAELGKKLGRTDLGITPQALAVLTRHPWPGNIRELRNALERAILLSEGEVLDTTDFRFDEGLFAGTISSAPAASPAGLEKEELEKEELETPRRQRGSEAEERSDAEAAGRSVRQEPAAAWEALQAELRRQIEATRTAVEVPPLGRWLAEDLLLAAATRAGGVLRQAAALLGIPNSTFVRQLHQAEARSTERPRHWKPMGPLLDELLHALHPPGSNLSEHARRALLEEVVTHWPEAGPALMGVAPPTFRRWRKALDLHDHRRNSGDGRAEPSAKRFAGDSFQGSRVLPWAKKTST